jgi:hypothetical protein
MQIGKKEKLIVLFWFFCIAYISLAVIGGIRNYSPVPHMDMWDGFLGFFIQPSANEFGAWWAQHNEHRIVLARLLFWIDQSLFSGAAIFLVTANYALVRTINPLRSSYRTAKQ